MKNIITVEIVESLIEKMGTAKYSELLKVLKEELSIAEVSFEDRRCITSAIGKIKMKQQEISRQLQNQSMQLKRKILICTACSDDYSIGRLCEDVNRNYSSSFEHEFVSRIMSLEDMLKEIYPREHCTWYKVKLILEILHRRVAPLKDGDYICWIDADAIFINFQMSLESIIRRAEERDLIIGEDLNPCCLVNAGVMLIRVSDWSKSLWQDVWQCDRYNDKFYYEQSALIRCLKSRQQGLELVKPFHSYLPGCAMKGDKVFANVTVLPRQDFNTNIGWTTQQSLQQRRQAEKSKAKLKLTLNQLSRSNSPTVEATSLTLSSSTNNNAEDDIRNCIVGGSENVEDFIDQHEENVEEGNNTRQQNETGQWTSSEYAGIRAEDEAKFIFHAAGNCHKLEALKAIIEKHNLPISAEVLSAVNDFHLLRGKCGIARHEKLFLENPTAT